MSRSCAATRCSVTVKPGMLMCREHWFMVPHRLRRAITETWRARHMSSYQDNVRQAVDLIDAETGAFTDALGGRLPGLPPEFVAIPFGGFAR